MGSDTSNIKLNALEDVLGRTSKQNELHKTDQEQQICIARACSSPRQPRLSSLARGGKVRLAPGDKLFQAQRNRPVNHQTQIPPDSNTTRLIDQRLQYVPTHRIYRAFY